MDVTIFSEVAAVFCLEKSQWMPFDGGVSRVAILHNYAVQSFRVVALSAAKVFVLNELVKGDDSIEQITDSFLGWRHQGSSFGFLFPSSGACTQFSQSFKLTANLAGTGGAATAKISSKDYDPEFDAPVSPISFGKAVQLIEDSVRALLTSSQNAVANPALNYDQMISTAICSLHKVLKLLLRLFVAKMRERQQGGGEDSSVGVVEKIMRGTFALLRKVGTDGVANEYTLKAAVGLRKMLVQRVLVEKIHEGFSGSLALAHQMLAALNAVKIIDNKSGSPGRQEGACMIQLCAVIQRSVTLMKQLADAVATFGKIARTDESSSGGAVAVAPASDDDAVESRPYWEECAEEGDEQDGAPSKPQTLNRLIQRLTSTRSMDTKFQQTFITTYQSFTPPRVLLRKLVERYDPPEAIAGGMENLGAVQMRVAIVLKYWAEHHFADFDEQLIQELYTFIDTQLRRDHEAMASKLHNFVSTKWDERSREIEVRFTVPKVIFSQNHKERPTSTISPIVLFYELEVQQLAQQLTLIDYEIYREIKPMELLSNAWNNKRLKHRAPHVLGLAARSTSLSFWVASVILCQTTQAQRIAMMSRMVSLAEALRQLNNYHTLMAVVSGLNTSPIHRLKNHWLRVPKKLLKTLDLMNQLMDPDHSFQAYRSALSASKLPALPFVGVHLTDLTFLEDGNPDTIEGKINFKKRELISDTIEGLSRFQSTSFNFTAEEPAHTYLLQLPSLTEDHLYELSLKVEPRK